MGSSPITSTISRIILSPDSRRSTFNEVAELYDRARPGYPTELFDDLAAVTKIGRGARVLEIGPGTGQATHSLGERGYEVAAVELGAELAEVARRRLADLKNVMIVADSFEDWTPPPEPFDVVFAATVWHWIDERIRLQKAGAVLRPGGSLVTVETHHVAGGTEQFFADSQACYQRWDPETPPDFKQPSVADVPFDRDELTRSGLFGEPVFRDYETDIAYTADQYVDVLRTYSGTLAMAPEAAEGLLDCIGQLITGRYQGQIVKHYLRRMRIARRNG